MELKVGWREIYISLQNMDAKIDLITFNLGANSGIDSLALGHCLVPALPGGE